MSLRLASRRLALPGAPCPVRPSLPSARGGTSTTQMRTKWSVNIFKGWGRPGARDAPSSKAAQDATAELDDPKKRAAFLERNMHGSVSDNIFQDEIDAAGPSSAREATAQQQEQELEQQLEQKTRENMAMVTDPDPRSRMRWQRRKVIQMVRSNGAVSKEDRIKATERQLLHKSHFMPTSVKKLVMLSRQIAGKPVDEAISQMQWSKKKMAAEVKYYLEEARDLAIAQRGMGLGKVNGEVLDKPRKIFTREGKWVEVTDPTRMYVAQSWVGRGPWRGKEIDYKGRGRMGVIQHPSTSFTVLLKEEKTRIREHEEREAKKAAKGPWVHLPNRRIHGQRPYYSW